MVTQPICGLVWYVKHRLDYTQRDIDSLTIQIKADNCRLPTVSNKDRGIVKDLVKSYRGGKLMEYTKGEWRREGNKIKVSGSGTVAKCPSPTNEDGVFEYIANAQLIASAPLGYELAEFVSRVSATWIEEGLMEMGEGDYIRMKQLALELKAKAEGQ